MQIVDITSDTTLFIDEDVTIANFNITSELNIQESEKRIVVTITINGILQDASVICTTVASFVFRMENIEEVIRRDEEGRLKMPAIFVELLNATAVSSSRGIVYSDLKNTKLKNIVLPLIPTQMLQPTEQGD